MNELNLDLFWDALEHHFREKWDLYMSKEERGVLVQLYVRAWDRTYRLAHDKKVVYEGTSRSEVERLLRAGPRGD